LKKIPFNRRAIWDFVVETYNEWSSDNAMTLGAALAFYTTFSLAPLFILVIAVFGYAVGQETVQAEILKRSRELIGEQGASSIRTMIGSYHSGSSILATILGILIILLGATSAFVMLKQALNIVWGARANPNAPIWNMVKERLLSFLMIFFVGILMILSLAFSVALSFLSSFFRYLLPFTPFFMQLADLSLSILLITLLFAVIYRVLPDVEIAWTDVWVGSVITAILFTAGKFLIGLYLGRSSVSSAYGAAGSLVIILLWIYYSAQIFLIGAEITKVYANWYGSHVRPLWNLLTPPLLDPAQLGKRDHQNE
jgi:membrane protein